MASAPVRAPEPVTTRRKSAPTPEPQRTLNRPFDDTVPRLRQQLDPHARKVVVDEVRRATLRDRMRTSATNLLQNLTSRPHVTEKDVEMFQFIGVWFLGVLAALVVHGLYWALTQ